MVAKYYQIVCLLCTALLVSCGSSRIHFFQKNPSLDSLSLCYADYQLGYFAVDANSKQTIASRQANVYFAPASTTKLFTSYVALRYLGDRITRFKYCQTGDTVHIYPYADPTWYDTTFDKGRRSFFDSIQQARGKKLQFKLYFPPDFSHLSAYGLGWSWEDVNRLFFKAPSMLCVGKNEISLQIDSDSISIRPNYLRRLLVASSEEQSRSLGKMVSRDFFSNKIFYTTDTAKNYAQYTFPLYPNKKDLVEILSEYSGQSFTWADLPMNRDLNWEEYQCTPTQDAVKHMLAHSDNFIADQLLLQSMLKLNITQLDSFYSFLRERDWKDMPQKTYWKDGSGLSRYNATTPQDIVYILQQMAGLNPNPYFLTTLLPATDEGILKTYHLEGLKDRLFAKTGSMRGVLSLAGVLYTKRKRTILFCIMINGKPISSTDCITDQLLRWYAD